MLEILPSIKIFKKYQVKSGPKPAFNHHII